MGMTTNTKRKKMNDFEQTRLADEVSGLHEIVEALLAKSCCCKCNCDDAEETEEE